MKVLLRDINLKFRREDNFKLTIRNDSLHQDGNENGVRTGNFTMPKNLVVKSTMFPH